MNERRETFENELTEEDMPDPTERDEAAHDEKVDPYVDAQSDGETMADDRYGSNEPDDA